MMVSSAGEWEDSGLGEEVGAVVAAAATRTMRGSARVTLTCRMSVPEYAAWSRLFGDYGLRPRSLPAGGARRVGDQTEAQVILDDPTTTTASSTDSRRSREAQLGPAACSILGGLLDAVCVRADLRGNPQRTRSQSAIAAESPPLP
jgi:hypothetical protein